MSEWLNGGLREPGAGSHRLRNQEFQTGVIHFAFLFPSHTFTHLTIHFHICGSPPLLRGRRYDIPKGLNHSAQGWIARRNHLGCVPVWHRLRGAGLSIHGPGVLLRSTPGYCLSTLRVALPVNLKGCQKVAGGRSHAETSGRCSPTGCTQNGCQKF